MSIWIKARDLLLPPARQWDEKANPAFLAISNYGDKPNPVSPSRNYKNYIKEGYRVDPTLHKGVSYIARNGAAIPPKLYTDRSCKKEIEKHPLLDKLNTPNNEMSGADYREAALGYLLLAGNTYQYAIRAKNAPPDELWPLEPDNVQVIPDRKRGVVGYRYLPAHPNQEDTPYSPADVRHDKYWSPDDPLYGLSPVEVIALTIDSQTSARKWNLALLQNWCRLPGAWVVPTPLAKNERDRLEAKLQEKFSGYRRAGAPPVLDGGLTWQNMGIGPAQMDWLPGIQYNVIVIANVLNLSPVIVGDTSATTYDNMELAEIYSYTEGVFPNYDKLFEGWNSWLVPMYPDLKASGAYLYYDKESVECIQKMIQAQKDAKSKRATAVYMAGQCTLDEARDMQGLPPLPFGQGKVFRMGAVLIRASKVLDYADQSLAKPAAAPFPQPEPLNGLPPGTLPPPALPAPAPTNKPTPGQPPVKPGQKPNPTTATQANGKQPAPAVKPGKARWLKAVADSYPDANYKYWENGPNPCASCAENGGLLLAIEEDWPNGCDSPKCHKNCQCQMTLLSIPDDTNPEDHRASTLLNLFAIAVIAGVHAHEEQEEDSEDNVDYGAASRAMVTVEQKDVPFRDAVKDRRSEYQRFIEGTI